MRAINESDLSSSLDSGSTKRLRQYEKRLSSDRTAVVFDDRVFDVIKRFAWDSNDVEQQRSYLNNLRDDRGYPFSRSLVLRDMLDSTIDGFEDTERPNFRWNKHFRGAFERVVARYSTMKCKMLTILNDDDMVNVLSDLDTSSGWDGILTGLRKKGDLIAEKGYGWFLREVEEAKAAGSFNKPVILATRSQASGEYDDFGNQTMKFKHKLRPVWMVSLCVVLAERQFAKPLIDRLKWYDYSAVGKDDTWLWRWVYRNMSRGRYWISLDYSKFDSTIPSWLIKAAFDVVKSAFCKEGFDEELFAVITEDFIYKNLVLEGRVVSVSHGNPSGSAFTTIINGICNELVTETWMEWKGVNQLTVRYNIMGDDNLIFYGGNQLDIDEIASYIWHNFGIKVNADKTKCGYAHHQDPEYLSRFWTVQGPWRDKHTLLSKAIYPERFRKYGGNVTPEIVVYSYILGYRAGMEQLLNVSEFLRTTNVATKNQELTREELRSLPYNVRLLYSEKL